jgi:predicted kinase
MHRVPSGARRRARLIVLAGLPGTGKSTLAVRLAEATDGVWLRVDTVEAALLKAGLRRSFATGLAAYVAVADLARDHLRLGRTVVVDAVNGVEEAREAWRTATADLGADRYVLELVCPDRREHRRRVEGRDDPTPPLPPPTWAEVTSRRYDPWTEPTLLLDTSALLDATVDRALRYVAAPPPSARRPVRPRRLARRRPGPARG